MTASIFPTHLPIEDLVAQILLSRKITVIEQQQLMCAMLIKEVLDEEEQTLIERVFYGIRHGLLRVIE